MPEEIEKWWFLGDLDKKTILWQMKPSSKDLIPNRKRFLIGKRERVSVYGKT